MKLVLKLLTVGVAGFGVATLLAAVVVVVTSNGPDPVPFGIDTSTALVALAFGGLIAGWLWTVKIGRDAGEV